MAERKCEHGPCQCRVQEQAMYCSQECRTGATDRCPCGHADCR